MACRIALLPQVADQSQNVVDLDLVEPTVAKPGQDIPPQSSRVGLDRAELNQSFEAIQPAGCILGQYGDRNRCLSGQ